MAFADDFHAPDGFHTDEFLIRPLVVADAALDYEAVMESTDFLRIWEQSTWPEDDFSVEANRKDMETMVKRHNERHSFGYTVMNLTETQCFGCIYIAPTDVHWLAGAQVTELGQAAWSDYDTIVTFWIRKSQLADQLDRRVLEAVRGWLTKEWSIKGHVISTVEAFDQQVTMIESTDLQLAFRLEDPADPSASLAYV